jgi:hypothetical protein
MKPMAIALMNVLNRIGFNTQAVHCTARSGQRKPPPWPSNWRSISSIL